MTTDEHLDLLSRMERVLNDRGFQGELAQIRSKATLQAIGEPATPPRWTYVAPRFCRNSAAALYALEAAALAAPDVALEHQDQSRQLVMAWESLAKLQEGVNRSTALLNAALAYELAGFQANATYLAREVLPEPEKVVKADAESLVASFLQRRFVVTADLANYLIQNPPDSEMPFDILSLNLGEVVLGDGLSKACRFLLSGLQSAYDEAVELLREAASLFDGLGAPLHANLAHGIRSVLPLMERRNTWNQLRSLTGSSEVWKRYLTLLARGPMGPHSRGVTELWPSQIRVLESGLLGADDSFVVRLPTSGGKTRIAEIAIVDTLVENPGAICVFVAPYRALAFEVERTLGSVLNDLGYQVSTIIGTYESDEFEDFLLRTADLLIATPEKLDLVLRVHPDVAEQIKLVVLDEVHLIDDASRGIKFEFLLSRMKAGFPHSRFLTMSAVIPDSTLLSLSAWLAGSPDRSISSDWRPTIQRIARFEWQGAMGVIRFQDDEDLPSLHTFVPGALRRKRYSFLHPETQRTRNQEYPKPAKGDTAAELAYVFSEQGPVLVFCTQPNFVESVCGAILNKSIEYRRMSGDKLHSYIYQSQQTRSLDVAKEWLGETHIATLALARGIALHHGRLPNVVREAIEVDCRAGRYKIIVATNTLAQGVNLPVRTVVIHSTWRTDGTGQRSRISVRDYWNIVGRAGRAGQETEGLVIHVTLNNNDRRDFNHYRNHQNLEPVSGALFHLLQRLVTSRFSEETMDEAKEEAAEVLDPEILAIAVEEGIENADSEKWAAGLAGTYAQLQADAQEISIDPLTESIRLAARGVFERAPEESWRQVYAQTGLRSSSCYTLRQFAENSEDLRYALLGEGRIDLHLLNRLVVEASFQLPEAETTTAFSGDPEVLLNLWTDGISIIEIFNHLPAPDNSVERLSRYIEELFGYRIPWIVSGLFKIFNKSFNTQDRAFSEPIRSYPSMVKYGLPDPVAAWAMAAGISARNTALEMARRFSQANSGPLSHEVFATWMANLSDDSLRHEYGITGYALDELQYKLGKMAVNPLLTPIRPLHEIFPFQTHIMGIQYENREIAARAVQLGDRLELRRDYGNPVDQNAIAVFYGSGQIGFLPRDIAQRLAPDIDAGRAFLAEVVNVEREGVPVVTVELRLE